MEAVQQIIQSLGFPIAVCVGLGWFMYRFIERIQTENKDREDRLLSILETYGNRMQSITLTLEKLCGDVDGLKKQ